MPGVEKIMEKMRNQPHGIRFNEAEKVLLTHGYSFNRQKGSHRHYVNASGDVITLIHESPLPKAYDDILTRTGEK